MSKADFLKSLAVTAEIFGRNFSDDAAECYLAELKGHPWPALLKALSQCRRELKFFPGIADIISRIEDGRPGVEEAWALCPKDETQSAVWTVETSGAFFSCYTLMEGDPIAARMAFKEKYTVLVTKARGARVPVKWEFTAGSDKAQRERVLNQAVIAGHLTADFAKGLLPDTSFGQTTQQVELRGPAPIAGMLAQLGVKK